jgi:dimethylargininase
MTEAAEQLFGGQTMVAPLRRVLVRAPELASSARWREFGWHAAPDSQKLALEHEQFCRMLVDSGAELVYGRSALHGNPDAIYTHDVSLISDRGAILLRPGKLLRHGEVAAAAADLELAGVPVVASLDDPACAEGGDILWLDERTLVIGRSYRTNGPGVEAVTRAMPSIEVVSVDLPHFRGAGSVLHLMSFISMLDRDLALVYPPLAPIRLLELLAERGVRAIEVPSEDLDTLGPNVLALAPRVALAVEGNPETRRRMERAGVDVTVYTGAELAKGDGGPTCLTRPLLRALGPLRPSPRS